jgi:hypothetical protein
LTRVLLLSVCICLPVNVLAGAEYVGAAACAECHKTQYEKQVKSRHAQSLRPIEGSTVAGMLLSAGHSPDGILRYEQRANGVAVRGDGISEDPAIQWAFGAGAQGITPVGRIGKQYFEHRFSYYSRIQGWAPTFGHPPHVSTALSELGMLQDNRTIFQCFNCHATDVKRESGGPDLSGILPGVQCERCHGPGSSHIQAAQRGSPREVVTKEVVNPGRFPARALIQICGQCHRLPSPDSGDEPELENPVTVRFAPIGLMASRCFRSSRNLSCVTCHDPHDDAKPRTSSMYTNACLGCHANNATPVRLCRRKERADCLPCHMKQASLGPYLRFTDHRIRSY